MVADFEHPLGNRVLHCVVERAKNEKHCKAKRVDCGSDNRRDVFPAGGYACDNGNACKRKEKSEAMGERVGKFDLESLFGRNFRNGF